MVYSFVDGLTITYHSVHTPGKSAPPQKKSFNQIFKFCKKIIFYLSYFSGRHSWCSGYLPVKQLVILVNQLYATLKYNF